MLARQHSRICSASLGNPLPWDVIPFGTNLGLNTKMPASSQSPEKDSEYSWGLTKEMKRLIENNQPLLEHHGLLDTDAFDTIFNSINWGD